MSTATMSYGMRARERMPFAWDSLTLGLVAALLLVVRNLEKKKKINIKKKKKIWKKNQKIQNIKYVQVQLRRFQWCENRVV